MHNPAKKNQSRFWIVEYRYAEYAACKTDEIIKERSALKFIRKETIIESPNIFRANIHNIMKKRNGVSRNKAKFNAVMELIRRLIFHASQNRIFFSATDAGNIKQNRIIKDGNRSPAPNRAYTFALSGNGMKSFIMNNNK